MTASAHAHAYPVQVADEDIDFMGHVNNAVYLKWVQAAVLDYWERVAPPEAVAQHLWVALKHEITYRRPTFLEDGIVAEVIAEKAQGARTFFSTLFKRGEEIVAEVSSVWCCLDAATQRPARLGKDVIARFVAEPGAARG